MSVMYCCDYNEEFASGLFAIPKPLLRQHKDLETALLEIEEWDSSASALTPRRLQIPLIAPQGSDDYRHLIDPAN